MIMLGDEDASGSGEDGGDVIIVSLCILLLDDNDAADNMYEKELSRAAGESAEEETEESIMSPMPVGPPSPLPDDEGPTPKEGSPYEVPVYIPDDIPIPSELELRESSVPGAGLGIWAKAKIGLGERFGPYGGMQSAAIKEATFGWEVWGAGVRRMVFGAGGMTARA